MCIPPLLDFLSIPLSFLLVFFFFLPLSLFFFSFLPFSPHKGHTTNKKHPCVLSTRFRRAPLHNNNNNKIERKRKMLRCLREGGIIVLYIEIKWS
jgi:hypothetical protein